MRVQDTRVLVRVGEVDGSMDLEGGHLDGPLAAQDLTGDVNEHEVLWRDFRPVKTVLYDEEAIRRTRK